MIERTAVVVIGAGITGLALGYHLRGKGISHVVLEASDRPGGVVRSARIGGHLLDWGPQRLRLTPSIDQLLRDLGLAGEVVTAPSHLPLLVYRDGRLRRVPFSAPAFLFSDIAPVGARLRALLEPFTAGARPGETVASYFTRKLGRDLYENLAGPLYGGLYASDPADMIVDLSLGHVLRELRVGRSLVLSFLRRGGRAKPPPIGGFREGMETLPRALHAANAENVRLDSPAFDLRREGGRWAVDWANGTILADAVVLTAPSAASARLLSRECAEAANRIGRLHYNPLAIVHLHGSAPRPALGFQVSLHERLATRGVTFNDSIFGREGVYTAYLGGAKAPEVVQWSDEEIGAVAVREFQTVTGLEARIVSVAREAMPAWDATWAAIQGLQLPDGLHIAANWQSRPGIIGRLTQAKGLAEMWSREGTRPKG